MSIQWKTFLLLRKSVLFSVSPALHLLKLCRIHKQARLPDVWKARASSSSWALCCNPIAEGSTSGCWPYVGLSGKENTQVAYRVRTASVVLATDGSGVYAILKTLTLCKPRWYSFKHVQWRQCLEVVTDTGELGVIQEKAGPIMVENWMYQWPYWE